ncbi:helix-turn-helix transcriptional regulator [Gloeobacter morelensis]|uniref:Helix-turn-helix transcriptional regulator n=1 Tax=Gloeobacter morelensis MG652769 TaxID=2781736 RepID=A0ABY3PM53_9CYAN|nr:AraC family transcriptional regulator [Gloeobacter morelensis]UFP94771.1 helix-turn-helix transcriptional regulator [Gloeobacter morelensis MG652769]
MRITISACNFGQFVTAFQELTGCTGRCDGAELTLRWPQQTGEGYYHWLRLRSGIELFICDYQLHQPVTIDAEILEFPALSVGFMVSGHFRSTLPGAADPLIEGQAGQSGLFLLPAHREVSELPAAERLRFVGMSFEPRLIEVVLEGQALPVAPALLPWMAGRESPPFFRLGSITSAMATALDQILHCPFAGVTRQLFLEGKALELVALQLEQTLTDGPSPAAHRRLHSDDIDRIHQARDILIANLEHPPTLLALARQVGLNDYKLKLGFQQVFGTTAFGYLHAHRLEQARRMLAARQINVSTAARAVGYTNLSAFSLAFKRRFGVLPSAWHSRRS